MPPKLFPDKITIVCRSSPLSLVQVDLVKQALLLANPHLQIIVQTLQTKGDKNMAPIPLDTVGKGWFTKEVEEALHTGRADIAIHSLKDMPEELAPSLIIGAVLPREDARDVLVSPRFASVAELPESAIIGTDSIRRKIQLLALRPDLRVHSVRGNIQTRLQKAEDGRYNGLILAAAGLKRLGLTAAIREYFDPQQMTPAPGQGAIAVQVSEKNTSIRSLLSQINDTATDAAVTAERAFAQEVGGGCKSPVGAYATVTKETIHLLGMLATTNAEKIYQEEMEGPVSDPEGLGKRLAASMKKRLPKSIAELKDFFIKIERYEPIKLYKFKR